jgi:4-hydroxybenzoate decarboxylase subunit C
VQTRPTPTDLPAFLNLLRKEGDLHVIDTPVDPRLELSEIHRRVIAQEGPALLFTNPIGARFPVVTNLFGTQRRVSLAFGPRPEALIREIASLPHTLLPPTLKTLWQHRSTIASLGRTGLRRRGSRSLEETHVFEVPRLTEIPILTTWKDDGGPFVTLPLVYTEDPRTRIHNLGMYRLQRFDDLTTGLHCQIGKGGGYHLHVAKQLGQSLPVNVFLGGPPALTLAAIAPLPENVPELLFASLVLGRKITTVDNPYGPLPLMADAEFNLVGTCNPNEMRPEGPFGDHYGYYSLTHDYPVLRYTGVVRKKNPIYPATVVGKPKQEDFFLGDYLQRLLSPLFPLVMPNVVDLWSYGETGYHSLSAAVVKQRYKREALAAGFRILGEGQLTLTKFLILVDTPQDLKDFSTVLEFVLQRADFRSDLYVFSNTAMDTLDYAGPRINEGSKGLLIGVGEPIRELPGEYSGGLPSGLRRVSRFCRGCLVVEPDGALGDEELVNVVRSYSDFAAWPLIVIGDNAQKMTASSSVFLWSVFTRFEPARDIHAAERSIVRNHVTYRMPIVIDARMKPWYPAEVEVDEETRVLVDGRWQEYRVP